MRETVDSGLALAEIEWLLGGILAILFIGWVAARARMLVKKLTVEAEHQERDSLWRRMDRDWGYVTLFLLAVGFLAWGFYVFYLVGNNFVFQGYALAAAAFAFMFFQLPQLQRPSAFVYVRRSKDGKSASLKNLDLNPLRNGLGESLLYFFIANTGINTYRDPQAAISLPHSLEPLGDPQRYAEVDLAAGPPRIARVTSTAYYLKDDVYPGTVFSLPLWIKAEESGEYIVEVRFAWATRGTPRVQQIRVQVHD